MTQAEESPSGGAVPAGSAQRIASRESPAAAAALRPDPDPGVLEMSVMDKDAVWSLRQALTGESQCRTLKSWSKAIPLTASHLKNSSWPATESLAVQLKYYATTAAHQELDISDLPNHS